MNSPHLIGDFIESISNPDGRFLTLRNIVPDTDSRGCPLFRVRTDRVVFSARSMTAT